MLFYLIYVSKATALMDTDGLLNLLDVSRAYNELHDLTGMLLYIHGEPAGVYGGRFMQVLEGSRSEVKHIFEKIKTDSRHDFVTLLKEEVIETRNFPDWRMGFKVVTPAHLRAHPGFVELNSAFVDSLDCEKYSTALNFLKSFYILRTKLLRNA